MRSESKTFAAGVCQDAPQGESEHDHSDTEIVFTALASSPQIHDPRDDLQEVTSGSSTAPSSIVSRGDVREWIIDTGTENHMVSRSRCVDDSDQPFKVDRPLRLATASGEITADQRIHKNVNAIGTILDRLVLDKTVDAISVGRLVLEKNFSFHWPSGENAYFIDTHGNRTECETKGFVSVLKHMADDDIYAFPCALPAVDEAEPQDPAQPDDQAEEHQPKNGKLKTEALSPEHMLLHRSKNPCCWVSGLSKMTAKQARKVGSDDHRLHPKAFGDHVCVDHVILNREKSRGLSGERAAVFIMDMFTRFTGLVPVADKTAEEAFRAIRYFLGEHKNGRLYSDNSKELEVAAKELGVMH